jgi:hypothetical protein
MFLAVNLHCDFLRVPALSDPRCASDGKRHAPSSRIVGRADGQKFPRSLKQVVVI